MWLGALLKTAGNNINQPDQPFSVSKYKYSYKLEQ